jgi:hypothetical protein
MHRLSAAAWRRTKIPAMRGAAAANSVQVATAADGSDARLRMHYSAHLH